MAFNSHHVCLKSYVNLIAGPWPFPCLIVPSFPFGLNFFYCILHIRLDFHRPLNLTMTHPFHHSHGAKWNTSQNVVQNAFASIVKNGGFTFHISKFMSFVATPLLEECEDDTHTPEMGTWESSGIPEISEFNCKGQNTLPWGVIYIIEKLSKCRCWKWPRMSHLDIYSTSYGKKKG